MTKVFNFRAYIEGIEKIYEIAKNLGYVQTRGGRGAFGSKGEGSPKQMLEAIAAGEAIVVRLDRLTSEQKAALK